MHVELRSLGKRFGSRFSRVTALCDVSLELQAGSRTALIGPNGSGKSTLVRCLMGMLVAEGQVLVDGEPMTGDRRALSRRIAYVPQIAPRLAAPVRDVVRAVAGLRNQPWSAVVAVADRLALDIDALAGRPFRALSGGQRQKVLAALALSSGAELLLLDEPTASMDPHSRSEFFQMVDGLSSAVTVLLCSHRLDEIRRLVDRVVVLAEGRVAWQGSATAYLAEHAEAIVEVHTDGEDAAAWLEARGFRRGALGWWSKSMPVHERAPTLRDIGRSLDGIVGDVMARDAERVQPPDAVRTTPLESTTGVSS